jgi:predicted aspartyl protease
MDHAILSWTACYDDGCRIHLSDKQGSGWYPQKPKSKGKGQPQKTIAYATSDHAQHLEVPVEVHGVATTAMIDSGAQGNHISQEWLEKQGIPSRPKAEPYGTIGISGGPLQKASIGTKTRVLNQ